MKSLVLVSGAAALAFSIPASLPTPARADVLVSGLGTTLCATVYNNRLQLNRCNGGDAQSWFSTAYGAQHYHNLCLDSAAPAGGSQLVVTTCQNKPSQRWALTTTGLLKNESGWCTDVNGGQASEGTRIQTWTCSNASAPAPHQRWATGAYRQLMTIATGAVELQLSKLPSGQTAKITASSSGGSVINTNGSSIVAQGGGNIVAQGGGNIVAQGGGNVIVLSGGSLGGGN